MKTPQLILSIALLLTGSIIVQGQSSQSQDDKTVGDRKQTTSTTSSTAVTTAALVSAPRVPPPKPTDTNFVVDSGQGLDTGCSFRSEGPLRITIPVARYMGELNLDGTLAHAQEMVKNGVISRFATLRLPAWDVDYDSWGGLGFPERDRILFNGVDIGPQGQIQYLTGANEVFKLNEFRIPIELIRFGQKGLDGGSPNPGLNVIEIEIDVENEVFGDELWCVAIDWAAIKFEAMAPVIMIHGNNSCGGFFEGDFNCRNGSALREDRRFVYPFIQQHIPYDNSITMATATVEANGTILAQRIPAIAKQFGANTVHLIVHSKGGLDTREALTRKLPANFGVLSLTSLSTPHHGSAGADYTIAASDERVRVIVSDDWGRTFGAWMAGTDAGTPDLTTFATRRFNRTNVPRLPRVFKANNETKPIVYVSFGADANIDGSADAEGPTINWHEEEARNEIKRIPFPAYLLRRAWRENAATLMYRLLWEVDSAVVERSSRGNFFVHEIRDGRNEPNDLLVTVTSSKFPSTLKTEELPAGQDNHASLASPAVGQQVIDKIKAIQPIK